MAKRRIGRKSKKQSGTDVQLTRTEALLAQILLHTMGSGGQAKRAMALHAANFSNSEIARLMGTTAPVVAQVLYKARRDKATGRREANSSTRKRR